LHQEQSWHGIPSLLDRSAEGPLRQIITEAAAEELPKENLERKLSETIRLVRNDWIERQLGQLTQRVADPALTPETFADIERQKISLRQQKGQPLQQVFVPGEA
jgi:hypothetical protein